MKSYFVNRYGAIEDIDFYPIFESIVGNNDNSEDIEAEADRVDEMSA